MNDATKNAIKAGAYTALWTFLALFGLSLAGWLNDVQQWATSDGAATVFPDPSVLVKAAAAAVTAAAGGLVGLVVRLAQAASGSASVPQYNNTPDA
jgi:hypothetical protein